MPTLPNRPFESDPEPDENRSESCDPAREFFGAFAPNAWKFYIPHVWDQERATWEDVYLVPTEEAFQGRSIWLTVEATTMPREFYYASWGCSPEEIAQATNNPESAPEAVKFAEEDYQADQEILKSMGNTKFLFHEESCTLYVRAPNFTRAELLEWVTLYLKFKGAEFPSLEEAPVELFSGSNPHAAAVEAVTGRMREFNSEIQREPPEDI